MILAAARVGGILANWEYPYEFVQENLAIELNVIHEAFRAGVKRLIFLGSSCIYPKLAPQPLKEEYLLTGPLEETNRPYAIAKIAGIELCRSLNREYGTEYLSLMPTNLYGPGDNFDLETSHLVPALIRKFHEAKAGWRPQRGGTAADAALAGGHSGAPARRAASCSTWTTWPTPSACFSSWPTGRASPTVSSTSAPARTRTIAELAEPGAPRSWATTARSTGTPASRTAPRRSFSTSAASAAWAGSRRIEPAQRASGRPTSGSSSNRGR